MIRALRRLVFVVLLLVSVGIVAGTGTLLWLHTSWGRTWARNQLLDALNSSLKGTFHLDRVHSLFPTGLHFSGLQVRTPEGTTVLSVPRLRARLDFGALWQRRLVLSELEIASPELSLAREGEMLGLVAAFEPAAVAPQTETQDQGSSWLRGVGITRLRIYRGVVDDLPGALWLQHITVETELAIDDDLHLRLHRGGGTLHLPHGEVARLERLVARLELAPGGESTLEARLAQEQDFLEVHGRASWGSEGLAGFAVQAQLRLSPPLVQGLLPNASAQLATNVEARLEAGGSLSDVTVSAGLTTAGGALTLRGRLRDQTLQATLATDSLDLDQVVPQFAAASVAGEVRLDLQPAPDSPTSRLLDVRLVKARFGDYFVPLARIKAVVAENHVQLEELEIPHLTREGGHLELTGAYHFDGRAELEARAFFPDVRRDVNVRRLSPGLHGSVRTELQARVSGQGPEELTVRGQLRVRNLSLPRLKISALGGKIIATGSLARPKLDLDLSGQGLLWDDTRLHQFSLRVKGGNDRHTYALRGQARLAGNRLVLLQGRVDRPGDEVLLDGRLTAHGISPTPLEATWRGVRFLPGQRVSAQRLQVTSDFGRLQAGGTYHFDGRWDLRARLADLDLAALDQALHLNQRLAGTLQAQLELAGSTRRPEFEGAATLTGGTIAGAPPANGHWAGRYSTRQRRASSVVTLDTGTAGRIEAQMEATLATRASPLQNLRRASLAGQVVADELDLSILTKLGGDIPPVQGRAKLSLELAGSLEMPHVELETVVRGLNLPQLPLGPLDLVADVALDADQLALSVAGEDQHGPLADLRAAVALDLARLSNNFNPRALLDRPWRVQAVVPPRQLAHLPGVTTDDLSGQVSGDFTLRGGENEPSSGELNLSVEADVPASLVRGSSCQPAPVHLNLHGTLRDNRTEARLAGTLGNRPALSVKVSAPTPVDDWLRTGAWSSPPLVDGRVEALQLPLEQVPWACQRAAGRAHAVGSIRGLLGDAPKVEFYGGIAGLQVPLASATDLFFTATASGDSFSLQAMLRQLGRDVAELQATLPLEWGTARGGVPSLAEERPWQGRLMLRNAPVEPLLAFVPGVVEPSGRLEGSLLLAREGPRVRAQGELELQQLSMTITEPYQRIESLDGRLSLTEDHVVIHGLVLRERPGQVDLSGRIALDQWLPVEVDLTAVAKEFPLRRDGIALASLDTEARLQASLAPEGYDVALRLHDLSVGLVDQLDRTVQSLAPNGEILFDSPQEQSNGQRSIPSTGPALAADSAAGVGRPIAISVQTDRPFWVRHSDFAIQLTANLQIALEESEARIVGPLRVRRGYVTLLTKTFNLQSGTLEFTGGAQVDPELDLRAVHRLPAGETVTVDISGRLSQPKLDFSTTAAGAETEQEIMALLVRGRTEGAELSAEQQTFSMLSGLTAGLLSNLVSRDVGSYLPVFAIDTVEGRGARVRAGLQADRFIPRFLRSVVRGAYVEGFVGASEQKDQGYRTTGGVSLELMFPGDIWGTATVQEPDRWSLDVTWQP
jgi:translocation and assembly module TamB